MSGYSSGRVWLRRFALTCYGIVVFTGWSVIGYLAWRMLGGGDPEYSEWFEWYFLAYMAISFGIGMIWEKTKPPR